VTGHFSLETRSYQASDSVPGSVAGCDSPLDFVPDDPFTESLLQIGPP